MVALWLLYCLSVVVVLQWWEARSSSPHIATGYSAAADIRGDCLERHRAAWVSRSVVVALTACWAQLLWEVTVQWFCADCYFIFFFFFIFHFFRLNCDTNLKQISCWHFLVGCFFWIPVVFLWLRARLDGTLCSILSRLPGLALWLHIRLTRYGFFKIWKSATECSSV